MLNDYVYLDQAGLERLVEYINTALGGKVNIGDLEDYVSKSDLANYQAAINGVYHFRGSVENLVALQAVQNPEVGDVYNIIDTGMNAAWTGEVWDQFGATVDLSPYVLASEVQAMSREVVNSVLYSGKSAIVTDVDGLKAMIDNDEEEVEIVLNKDINNMAMLEIPEGKKVTLDLGGNSITAPSTVISVDGGELVIKDGSIASSTNPTIVASNGATVTVDRADITSSHHNGINATESEVIFNSGSVTSQEAGIAGFKDSVITINGGVITGIDNGPLMGNGSPAGSDRDGTNMNVVMNGGKLVAHIQSAGYLACAVYVPNSGSFTMNGGEIESDGCGICMRGGQVNLNGGSIIASGTSGVTGKVGDSRVVVGPYAVVYDAQSKYPGVDTLELNIAEGMILQGTDGDIQIVESSYTPNINDNRVLGD